VPLRRDESGVGRERTLDGNAPRPCRLDCGDDDFFLLAVAEEPVLAGMRIQSQHGKVRTGPADALHRVGGEFDHVEDALHREQGGHLVVAAMDGDKTRADFVAVLEHAGTFGPGFVGKDFGVAGIENAGGTERFLVERSGCHAGDLSGESRLDRGNDVAVTGGSGSGAYHAGFEVGVIKEG